MTIAPNVELTFTFQDPDLSPEKQEKLTQTLWQQMRSLEGVKVDRVADPNPPEGNRALGAFLWGLLQAEVSVASLKNLFGFVGDRLGNKPIKIKAKFADGREIELEVSSREELAAAEETIKRLSQSM
ncbi:hypothetical protein C7B65_01095 [Phormidesmis priestleyi ULC007]|uniref:Uncharacterized protein n=1 Tax=Phormidesmis priestleyi ULC007 TaxID=1920490 RepID=A0A2T1DNH0_9CYAN|nr:hypothetical protein [Phormidesmis priestleyi]PSB22043.1 hypothetical protein C7B65_01095 [Phormidesmis priestleyi ULC007]PZO54989.1 MAG: hypothetical protein DCF14_00480 [Phormidesmis priestleyi]